MSEYGQVPETVLRSDGGNLLCPRCGSDVTHIDEVSAGVRRGGEDSAVQAMTFSAVTGETRGPVHTDLAHSPRRHWIEIHIDCELCPGGSLILAQHKGSTRVSWVPVPSARVPNNQPTLRGQP